MWPLLHMLKDCYNVMQTTFELLEKWVFNLRVFVHTLLVTTYFFIVSWFFYTSSPLSIALLHFEKDNKHGLSNFSGLRFVPCCREENDEVHQCKKNFNLVMSFFLVWKDNSFNCPWLYHMLNNMFRQKMCLCGFFVVYLESIPWYV